MAGTRVPGPSWRGSVSQRPDRSARCPLLGYAMRSMQIEGTLTPHWLLELQTQPEIGEEGYDAGAAMLYSSSAEN